MKPLESNIPTLNTAAICERLKQVRIQVCGPRGQSHFAALLHLSPSTYNYYEKGRIPPVDVLDRAARVTGAPLLWLIRGEPAEFSLESLKKIEPPVGTTDAGANVNVNGAAPASVAPPANGTAV
jgi:transcriptional regulator with XRE-family HTH domain